MYEGLTRELLQHSIPVGLDLQVVSGLVIDGRGGTSGQIDCMLVRGKGASVPYSPGIYQWHVKDVIAVFEVKKTLSARDMADAYLHLRDVLNTYVNWSQTATNRTSVDLRPTSRAYAQAVGEVAPGWTEWPKMPADKLQILRTMMADQIAPLRIIFGYEGYSTERGLREGFLAYLGQNVNARGFGPQSLPSLVVAQSASLVKLSGHPYFAPRQANGHWPIMASSHHNPLRFVLELLWTRLSYDYPMAPLFGDDLDEEVFAPLLDAEFVESAASPGSWGWGYHTHELRKNQLAAGPDRKSWSPVVLDATQFVIISQLCREDIDADNPDFRNFLEREKLDAEAFIDGLIATTLVARNGRFLTLTTDECMCVILPDGRRVAGENSTGRLTRWVDRFMEQSRSTTAP